jgi:spermidine synthase
MSLLDAFMMGEDAVHNYAGEGKIHTDDRPYLEFFNAKSLVQTTQRNVEGLSKYRQRVTPWLANYGQTFDEKKQIRDQINHYFSATQKLIKGQIAYAGRDYNKAGQVLGEAFSSNKDDMTIRYNLQVVLGLTQENQQEEITQLEKQLKQKLRQNPQDAEAYFQLAVIYEMQGELDKSADAAEESLNYNPNQLELYLFLGPLYERQEKIDRALGTYERLEKIVDELPPEILGVMASIYHMKGLDDKAVKYAENAFEFEPDSWKVNHLLGTIYLDQKHEKKAIRFYLKAIELAPDAVQPLISLAQLHFSQQQYDQALQSINQAIKLVPEDRGLKELRQQIWNAM